MEKDLVTIEDFEKIDIRLGKIIEVEDFPEARKPAFKLKIDFGNEIGIKRSSAQLVGPHSKEDLLNKLVICVVNFSPRQVRPFISEVLTLGFKDNSQDGYLVATASKDSADLGSKLC